MKMRFTTCKPSHSVRFRDLIAPGKRVPRWGVKRVRLTRLETDDWGAWDGWWLSNRNHRNGSRASRAMLSLSWWGRCQQSDLAATSPGFESHHLKQHIRGGPRQAGCLSPPPPPSPVASFDTTWPLRHPRVPPAPTTGPLSPPPPPTFYVT